MTPPISTAMTAANMPTGGLYPLPLASTRRSTARRFRRLTTLRLVRECSFNAPDGYPGDDVSVKCPRDVFERMTPFAERETVEVFWVLPLNVQHRLIGNAPEAVTRLPARGRRSQASWKVNSGITTSHESHRQSDR
jgi:DNA repair protein RadC